MWKIILYIVLILGEFLMFPNILKSYKENHEKINLVELIALIVMILALIILVTAEIFG